MGSVDIWDSGTGELVVGACAGTQTEWHPLCSCLTVGRSCLAQWMKWFELRKWRQVQCLLGHSPDNNNSSVCCIFVWWQVCCVRIKRWQDQNLECRTGWNDTWLTYIWRAWCRNWFSNVVHPSHHKWTIQCPFQNSTHNLPIENWWNKDRSCHYQQIEGEVVLPACTNYQDTPSKCCDHQEISEWVAPSIRPHFTRLYWSPWEV